MVTNWPLFNDCLSLSLAVMFDKFENVRFDARKYDILGSEKIGNMVLYPYNAEIRITGIWMSEGVL